jgi:hypothetical protein
VATLALLLAIWLREAGATPTERASPVEPHQQSAWIERLQS